VPGRGLHGRGSDRVSACHISQIHDTGTGQMAAACMVHATIAPCWKDGEPAVRVPVHVDETPSREEAVEAARRRVAGSRPIVVHRGFWSDGEHETGAEFAGCWCGAVMIPAG